MFSLVSALWVSVAEMAQASELLHETRYIVGLSQGQHNGLFTHEMNAKFSIILGLMLIT